MDELLDPEPYLAAVRSHRAWLTLPTPEVMHPLTRSFIRESDRMVVIFSVDVKPSGRWIHASASFANRTPTWAEMDAVKRVFIGDDLVAVQVHPRRTEHFNLHPHCLHIWACLDGDAVPDLRNSEGGV